MNPILLNIASEFYTERLLIRVPLPRDGKAVFNAIQLGIGLIQDLAEKDI